MKKLLFAFPIVALLAAGCSSSEQANNQKSVAQNPTSTPTSIAYPTPTMVASGAISYTPNENLFTVTKKEFTISSKFNATILASQSTECGTNKTKTYFQGLLSKYSTTDKGTEYNFTYKGKSQNSDGYSVTVIPNKLGYKTLAEFQADFNICAAGASLYPALYSNSNLLFTSSCGGVDDGSGLPNGCIELKKAIEPTLKLQ